MQRRFCRSLADQLQHGVQLHIQSLFSVDGIHKIIIGAGNLRPHRAVAHALDPNSTIWENGAENAYRQGSVLSAKSAQTLSSALPFTITLLPMS